MLVVGETPDAFRGLETVAENLGLGRRVQFVGRVPLEDLGLFGCAADACVQLRYPPRGETSAALLRALAAGSACVVSEAGSFAELPEGVALRVRTPDHELDDLSSALVRLHDDPALGERLRDAAVRFVEGEHSLDEGARKYADVIRLTIARRTAGDARWRDAACAALVNASQAAVISDAMFESWAAARTAARRT
jgi:glycosyltransferase involved in cell wall biosynthesis